MSHATGLSQAAGMEGVRAHENAVGGRAARRRKRVAEEHGLINEAIMCAKFLPRSCPRLHYKQFQL